MVEMLSRPDMYRTAENKARLSYLYDLRSYLLFWTLTFFIHICRIPVILTDITKNSKEKRVAGVRIFRGPNVKNARPQTGQLSAVDYNSFKKTGLFNEYFLK